MIALIVMIVAGGVASVIITLVAVVKGEDAFYPTPTPHTDVYVHDAPQQPPNPTIAEQFDGRLTNVFRNPMEGIL